MTVILITGASSGFGRAIGDHLNRLGHSVYGTSRDPASRPPADFTMLQVNLTDDASIQQAVDDILTREGRIDVLVNNAGYALAGAVEDVSSTEAQAIFEANFFAAHRTIRAVLPSMRTQRSGLIINISSVGGVFALPYQSMYSASKFALEAMSEALRMEVMQFGIRVTLIEPGDFKTEITDRRIWAAASAGSVYDAAAHRAIAVEAQAEREGPSPDRVARLVERIMRQRSPKLRYTVGKALDRSTVILKWLLPPKLGQWILMKYYDL